MCGRFTLISPERVKLDHPNRSDLPLLPRYNIAPSQTVLALADFGNGPELAPLTWGLIPSWSNEPKGSINARAETLDTTQLQRVISKTTLPDSGRRVFRMEENRKGEAAFLLSTE
jgi:putative SOS response-associated peptidase YedK